jgi:hypothetical protein
MYKRHAELVNSTPFDLTFQDKINFWSRNPNKWVIKYCKTNNTGLAKLVEQSTHELTTTIKTVEKEFKKLGMLNHSYQTKK